MLTAIIAQHNRRTQANHRGDTSGALGSGDQEAQHYREPHDPFYKRPLLSRPGIDLPNTEKNKNRELEKMKKKKNMSQTNKQQQHQKRERERKPQKRVK